MDNNQSTYETSIRHNTNQFNDRERKALERTCQDLKKCWEQETKDISRQEKVLYDKLRQLQHEQKHGCHYIDSETRDDECPESERERRGSLRRSSLVANQSKQQVATGSPESPTKHSKQKCKASDQKHHVGVGEDVAARALAYNQKRAAAYKRRSTLHTFHYDQGSNAESGGWAECVKLPDIREYRSGRTKASSKSNRPKLPWGLQAEEDKVSQSVPEMMIKRSPLSRHSSKSKMVKSPERTERPRRSSKHDVSNQSLTHVLPSVPTGSRSSLTEANAHRKHGGKPEYAGVTTKSHGTTSHTQARRTSMVGTPADRRTSMVGMPADRRTSIVGIPSERRTSLVGTHADRRTSIGRTPSDRRTSMVGIPTDREMTPEDVERFFNILANSESFLKKKDRRFSLPTDRHGSLSSMQWGSRRQQLAMQTILCQLPSFRRKIPFDPEAILNCRYLRLTKDNIEELEELCREMGKDPGIHAHMTEEQVEEYYNRLHDQDSNADEEELKMEDL